MKFVRDCWDGFAGEIVVGMLFMVYTAAGFVIFDAFHITDLGAQVLAAIAPFLALAYWAWRRGKLK